MGSEFYLKGIFTLPPINDHPAQCFLNLLSKNYLGSVLTIHTPESYSRPDESDSLRKPEAECLTSTPRTLVPVSALREESQLLKPEAPARVRDGVKQNAWHCAGSTPSLPIKPVSLRALLVGMATHSDKLGFLPVFANTMRSVNYQPILSLRHRSEFRR